MKTIKFQTLFVVADGVDGGALAKLLATAVHDELVAVDADIADTAVFIAHEYQRTAATPRPTVRRNATTRRST